MKSAKVDTLERLLTLSKRVVNRIPLLGPLAKRAYTHLLPAMPFNSTTYWKARYQRGGNSGLGSYGVLAQYKADYLNVFVAEHNIQSVIEFGCGDGNQLSLANYPSYLGFDVSPHAVALCQARFQQDDTKSFHLVEEYAGEGAELALSLDVVYHLVEDEVFRNYLKRLFACARRYVIIYSSDFEEVTDKPSVHVRHRKFTDWVETNISGWRLTQHIPNPYHTAVELENRSTADFYLFEKTVADEPFAPSSLPV